MGDGALAPDVQLPNGTQLDGGSCWDHTVKSALEYGAAVRFVGLLAGIKGPLGTDDDVAQARQAVRDALTSIGLGPPSSMSAALNESQYADIAKRKAADDLLYSFATPGWTDPEPYADLEKKAATIIATPGTPGKILSAARNLLYTADQARVKRAIWEEMRGGIIGDFFSSLWDGIVEVYNKVIAAIKDGTWKVGLCKLGVDTGFAVLEGLVLAGLAAFTGGVAAALVKIVKTAVQSAAKLTGMVRIAVRAERQLKAQRGLLRVGDMHAERPFRDIDPRREGTPDEKKLLGEENQGNVRPTDDKGPAEANGAGAASPKAWRGKEVAGRKVFQRDDLIDPNFVDPETGLTNLQRMQRGKAPIGPDGKELPLHHVTQDEPGPVAEITATRHQENFRQLHIYANQYDKKWRDRDGAWHPYSSAPPSMNRQVFDKWKEKYWAERALDFQ